MNKSVRLAVIVAAVLGPLASGGWIALQWKNIIAAAPAEQVAGPEKPTIKPKAKEWDFVTTELDSLAKDLREERESLEVRRKDLEAVSKRVAAEKEELKRIRTELEELRDSITKSVPVLQTTEAQNLKTLSKAYSAMKPAQAVSILIAMEDASIVKLLGSMKVDAVSQILAEMARTAGPDGPLAPRAALLSEQLRLLKKDQPLAAAQ